MDTGSLLIAETDPAVLQALPQLLSSRLPLIAIDIATSADEAHQKLSQVRYSASVIAPTLVGKKDLRLHKVQNRSVLMPIIVTATATDVEAAREALLDRGAFDVITKPMDATDALNSIRVALWQSRFLRLLTQRERALEQFKHHIEAYPTELEARAIMESVLKNVEKTLSLMQQSMICIERGSDHLFFDVAVSIQERTKDRALDRLNRLITFPGNGC